MMAGLLCSDTMADALCVQLSKAHEGPKNSGTVICVMLTRTRRLARVLELRDNIASHITNPNPNPNPLVLTLTLTLTRT